MPAPTPAAPAPRPRAGRQPAPRPVAWHLAAAAALALLLYAPTLGMGFVWDDEALVLNNPVITRLSNLPGVFASHAFAGMGRGFVAGLDLGYYRPVWISTLLLDHSLWGLRPFGYHLTNVLLHAAVTVLVYLLALGLLRRAGAALAAAALFAAHPVHAEAVAWVSGRNELLAALFTCLALLAYVRFRERPSPWVAAAGLAAYGLGLLSKEMAAVLPALALLWESRGPARRAWERLAGPLALALATVPYLVLRQAMVSAAHRPGEADLVVRLLDAPRILLEYVRLLVLPVGLKTYYPLRLGDPLGSPTAWLALLALVALVAGVAWLWRRDRTAGLGLGWALVALLPVSGIPAVIRPTPVADRYLYLSSIGLCLAAGAWLARALEAGSRGRGAPPPGRRVPAPAGARRAVPLVGLLVAALSVATVARSRAWQDYPTFLDRMIADAPDEPTGWFNRGLMGLVAGRLDAAQSDFETARRLNPADARVYLRLADIQLRRGRPAQARPLLEEALRRNPRSAEAHLLVARLEYAAGRWSEAEGSFRAVLGLDPGSLDGHLGLGATLTALGRTDEAEREYRAVIARDARNVAARQNLANLLATVGRKEEGLGVIRAAVDLAPADATTRFNLGVALEDLGRLEEAEAAFRAAIGLDTTLAAAHHNLGVVLWKRGRADEAEREIRQAIRLAPAAEAFQRSLASLGAPPPAR